MHHTDDFDRLDTLFGPAAVMDLDQRNLLPGLTGTDHPIADRAGDRILGALLGAAIGNALGRPTRHRSPGQVARRFGPVTGFVRSPRSSAPAGALGAEGRLMVSWADALAEHGEQAAPTFSERLPGRYRRLRSPGSAITTTVDRLRKGAPWFAAAPDSFGNGALLRAVVDGARWLTEPDWRPTSAALGAAVTHAHPQAVAASVVLAELVAAGIAEPHLLTDPVALAHELADRLDEPTVAEALRRLPRTRADEPTAVDSLTRGIALFARHGDAEAAMLAAVNAGGSSDVTAGVVGALAGAQQGPTAFPSDWVRGVEGADRLTRRAQRLTEVQGFRWSARNHELARRRPTLHEWLTHEDVTRRNDDEPVHIWYLIDRSGSMSHLQHAVVEGFNRFLAEQQELPGQARLTLVQFDSEDPYEVLVDGARLESVSPTSPHRYQPRAMTPLYDAMGSLIDAAEARVADRARRGKPAEDQLVVVFTDGLENASRRWDRAEIFARIEAKKAEGWTFAYLGANQDSYDVGHRMGLSVDNVSNFAASPEGFDLASVSASRATRAWRSKSRDERYADADAFFGGLKEAEGPISH